MRRLGEARPARKARSSQGRVGYSLRSARARLSTALLRRRRRCSIAVCSWFSQRTCLFVGSATRLMSFSSTTCAIFRLVIDESLNSPEIVDDDRM